MADKMKIPNKRTHKESAGVNRGARRFTTEQGFVTVKVKDKDGRYRGRTKEVPRRVRGLSNVQKVLFAKPKNLMSARRGIR